MAMTYDIYLYIDGESHYIRAQETWRKLHGSTAKLDAMRPRDRLLFNANSIQLWVDPKIKLLWDSRLAENLKDATNVAGKIARQFYFTSASGDTAELHQARVRLRSHGFDACVVHEPRQLANQRENLLATAGVIEKAKGVDIGLTVQILEDAHHDNFDACFLITSDIDYLPVIETVRRLGKQVHVAGFRGGLGRNSAFEHVPDTFTDLEDALLRWYDPITTG